MIYQSFNDIFKFISLEMYMLDEIGFLISRILEVFD